MDGQIFFSPIRVVNIENREDLKFLGSVTGREDRDKVKKTSLTPIEIENTMAFNEANIIFICKKLYTGRIEENNFLNTLKYILKNILKCQ